MALTLGDIKAEVGGHYSKHRIIWPRQHGAGQLRCDGPGLYAACCYIRRLMTHVISPASAPAQPPTSQRSGFPNNSFRRAATMFISLCGATHGWRWCVGESYQPKYYLLMVVSRCWEGVCLVGGCQLTTAQVRWCPSCFMQSSRSSLTPVTVTDTDTVQRSAAAGARRGKCGTCWKIGPGLACTCGLGWLGWAGWLIFSGFGRPPRVMRSWWTDP